MPTCQLPISKCILRSEMIQLQQQMLLRLQILHEIFLSSSFCSVFDSTLLLVQAINHLCEMTCGPTLLLAKIISSPRATEPPAGIDYTSGHVEKRLFNSAFEQMPAPHTLLLPLQSVLWVVLTYSFYVEWRRTNSIVTPNTYYHNPDLAPATVFQSGTEITACTYYRPKKNASCGSPVPLLVGLLTESST